MSRKMKPVIVQTTEGFQALVGEIVNHKLDHAALTTAMEQEIAAVQRRYQDRLADLGRQIECGEAGAQGVVVEPQKEQVMAGMNALVHQGVSVAEALETAEPERVSVPK